MAVSYSAQYLIRLTLLTIFFQLPLRSNAETISVKLLGGSTSSEGTIWVKRGSDWGLVCDDGWDMSAGNVICRQLGYSGAEKITTFNRFQAPSTEKIFLDDVKCLGHETNLGGCRHREWMTSNCHAGEAAGVVCRSGVINVEIGLPVRALPEALPSSSLIESDTAEADLPTGDGVGTLEITINQPSANQPTVVQPSYGDPVVPTTPDTSLDGYSARTREILARVQKLLAGQSLEPQPDLLSSVAETVQSAEPSSVSVVLPAPEPVDSMAALAGVSGFFDFRDDDEMVEVVEPAPLDLTPEQGDALAAQQMQKVDDLIEEMVEIPYHVPYPPTPNIGSQSIASQPVGPQPVVQRPAAPLPRPYRVEILGGRRSTEGYVKVTLDNGKAGTICSDNWGIYEAMVICRQTGNQQAERSTLRDYYGAYNEDKVIYEVNCDGHERTIADCQLRLHDGHGAKCSRPTNVAGVVCTSAKMADLIPNIPVLYSSLYIEDKPMYSLTCAKEEKCLSSSAYTATPQVGRSSFGSFGYPNNLGAYGGTAGNRKLMRFSSSIFNNGTADFRPNQHRSSWEWHSCHQHYHSMSAFSHYDILDSHGNKVAEGHKASFCLEDVECDWPHRKQFSCRGFADQGISVGCADVYKSDIDCQWVDITDLRPGAYVFKLNVNPQLLVPELNYDNNAAICELTYNGYSAKLSNCVLSRG